MLFRVKKCIFSMFQRKASSSKQSSDKSKSESTILSFLKIKHFAENSSQQIYHLEPKRVEILVRFQNQLEKMVFRTQWRFWHFRFFMDFGGDFGSVLVEKTVWPFSVEKMGSPVSFLLLLCFKIQSQVFSEMPHIFKGHGKT